MSVTARYPRVAAFRTVEAFRAHVHASNITLPLDAALEPPARSPLAAPFELDGVRVGNRFCVLPMEGWDGTADGEPSELTIRRWQHFGQSGAKLIWGGEAVAVRHDGRANPRQLLLSDATLPALARLRETLIAAHVERFGAGSEASLYVGLQLTHSGRFAKPSLHERPEPIAAMTNPLLDRRFAHAVRVFTDAEIRVLIDDFVIAAKRAAAAGYQFVDVKHCHGYFGHEILGARSRPGEFGGSLENRTRFMREVIDGIRAEVPGLAIAVRLSAFDLVPHRKSAGGPGVPETRASEYSAAFGLFDGDMDAALAEARDVLRMLEARDVRWICITAGSPYYCPHTQRPALFPPSDGYEPPEDPLHGVARLLDATGRLKAAFPRLAIVGTGYSYLQEWLPHVAQYQVRHGLADFVGLGRMMLAYPELPADLLRGAPLRRKAICRTFSDCTTGPRMGLVSGCYPLDPFYLDHPDGARLRDKKATVHSSG
jgi:2,4-dienoyl-CoA reductase-like NADH-dependent reductase (Old Yellow Enzyme family)